MDPRRGSLWPGRIYMQGEVPNALVAWCACPVSAGTDQAGSVMGKAKEICSPFHQRLLLLCKHGQLCNCRGALLVHFLDLGLQDVWVITINKYGVSKPAKHELQVPLSCPHILGAGWSLGFSPVRVQHQPHLSHLLRTVFVIIQVPDLGMSLENCVSNLGAESRGKVSHCIAQKLLSIGFIDM